MKEIAMMSVDEIIGHLKTQVSAGVFACAKHHNSEYGTIFLWGKAGNVESLIDAASEHLEATLKKRK